MNSLFMILLSIGSLFMNWKSSKLNYILKKNFYSTKPFRENNFCLKDFRFWVKFDLVLLGSCLILGLCLLECNPDFINVFGIYKNQNYSDTCTKMFS